MKEPKIRLVSYLPITLARRLKAKLALEGKTISEWARQKAEEELKQEE